MNPMGSYDGAKSGQLLIKRIQSGQWESTSTIIVPTPIAKNVNSTKQRVWRSGQWTTITANWRKKNNAPMRMRSRLIPMMVCPKSICWHISQITWRKRYWIWQRREVENEKECLTLPRQIMRESSSSKGAWQRGKFSEKQPILSDK